MKKLTFLSAAVAAALVAVPAFAQDDDDEDEAPAKKPAPKMLVAVDKFEGKAGVTHEGQDTAKLAQVQNLRDRVTHYIVACRKFEVVERENIKSILSERLAAQNGLVREEGLTDEEQADKLENQKLKMAGYVIYGSVLSIGNDASGGSNGGVDTKNTISKVEMELRISSAETGKILASKTVIGRGFKQQTAAAGSGSTSANAGEQALAAAVDAAALQCVDQLLELSFPPKVLFADDDEVTINLPRELVHIDEVFDIVKLGKKVVDEDTGDVYQKEKKIGRVKISDFTPTACKAVPVGDLDLEDVEPGMRVRRVDPERLDKERKEKERKMKANFESRF